MPDQNWQFELEEYIKQGEPDRAEKSEAWQTAIGLQAVDGLKTSDYLLDTAKDHIEGKITIDEAQKRIHSYYEQRTTRTEIENETKEADIVSARITKLLGEKTFQFSPAEWITIHRRLFEGVFDHAGQIRKYNISKNEWILNGETVIYADFNSIKDTLDYDFATEKQFSYEGLSVEASVKHLAKFASDIWQIHVVLKSDNTEKSQTKTVPTTTDMNLHYVSLEWAKQIFTTLEKSRNVIMHSGELGERDIERIGINIRDWISQVGA